MVRINRRIFSWFIVLFCLMLAISVGWVRWWWHSMLLPPKIEAADLTTIRIPVGATTHRVAELLYQQRLIREPVVFRYYARFQKLDGQLKPGEYQLSAAMSADAILQKLTRGEVVIRRFTLPEGLTIEQIGDNLAAQRLVAKKDFLQAAADSGLISAYLPDGVKLDYPMEGYLFPDTYVYEEAPTAQAVVQLMFERFERLWTPERLQRAVELGLAVHQVVTLASIIEKEAQVAQERAIISGVYHNRLRAGMKLDADPTVRYGLKKPTQEALLYADLEIESPYNTYRLAGLPPGPIAAPGEASIHAALFPEIHDYWYFVAKGDGSGGHYFATTLSEQNENIARYEKNSQQ